MTGQSREPPKFRSRADVSRLRPLPDYLVCSDDEILRHMNSRLPRHAQAMRQAFLVQEMHQPLAATDLPGNSVHGPSAAPDLPE